jgi:hypothetical protein
LRNWNPTGSGESDPNSVIYGYRRLKVFKKADNGGNNIFRLNLLLNSPLAQVRLPPQQVPARLRMSSVKSSVPGQKSSRWEASFDFDKVPLGDYMDLIVEELSPGTFLHRGERSTTLSYAVHSKAAEVTRWILLPKGKEYRNWRIVRYKTEKPDKVEPVKIVTEYLAEDYTILAYKLLSVEAGYTYELTWYYK